jgi:hypothetical protein
MMTRGDVERIEGMVKLIFTVLRGSSPTDGLHALTMAHARYARLTGAPWDTVLKDLEAAWGKRDLPTFATNPGTIPPTGTE